MASFWCPCKRVPSKEIPLRGRSSNLCLLNMHLVSFFCGFLKLRAQSSSVSEKFGRMGLAPDCLEANDELGAGNTWSRSFGKRDCFLLMWACLFVTFENGWLCFKQKGTLKENNPMCQNRANGFHQGETPICRMCVEEGPPFCFEDVFCCCGLKGTKGKPKCIFWCPKKGTQALALP